MTPTTIPLDGHASGPARSSDNVLVIGAGPVGLMIALRLAQAGIAVDVIEKEERLSQQPRAVGYHAGALLALQRTSVYLEAKKLGFMASGVCWRKPLVPDGEGAMKLGEIIAQLASPSNEKTEDENGHGVLHLPQARLAALFHDAAVKTGLVKVHFQKELCQLRDEGGSVTAFTQTPDGELECFHGGFLVGADGGRSTTRKLLGIAFQGHSWPERIVATDILLEDKCLDHTFPTSLVIHPINFGIITPLEPVQPGKKTLYRCSIAVDPKDARSNEELESEEHLRSLLATFIPGPRPLDIQIHNASAYRTHQLCASTLRKGRCLLAGDAAHMNNPFGALGLTTGLLDADALSDALELIINDKKPMEILDIYSDERRKVFQTFVDPVSTWNKLRMANDPETAHEDWMLRAASKPSPEFMAQISRSYFDIWRTDMEKLVASKGL